MKTNLTPRCSTASEKGVQSARPQAGNACQLTQQGCEEVCTSQNEGDQEDINARAGKSENCEVAELRSGNEAFVCLRNGSRHCFRDFRRIGCFHGQQCNVKPFCADSQVEIDQREGGHLE